MIKATKTDSEQLFTSGLTPAESAQKSFQEYKVQPVSMVHYVSHGHLLVLGKAVDVQRILCEMPVSLKSYILLIDQCPQTLAEYALGQKIPVLDSISDIIISGFLGAFQVRARSANQTVDVNAYLHSPESGFDIVLELLEPSIVKQRIPPVGYFSPGSPPDKQKETLMQLSNLIGEFDKPKYYRFDVDKCAHASNGLEGCRLCIDVCTTEAISSRDLKIEVDSHLCQGCGECTAVCPSGAISYSYPSLSDSLNRIRHMLDTYFFAGGKAPILLFHDMASGYAWLRRHRTTLPINVLFYEVESLGSVGMDIWLAAMAYGAIKVMLLDAGDLTELTSKSIETQIVYTQEILAGIGYSPSCLKLIKAGELKNEWLPVRSSQSITAQARFSGTNDKRITIHWAVEHLLKNRQIQQDSVKLSDGAPFGEIQVNSEQCTLCMACVSICPASALSDGLDQPKLKFIEYNCVQCGLCENVCPEDAISLNSRYLFDAKQAKHAKLLHEEATYHCIQCGKPFATQSMIKTMLERLKDHPMFQGENSRRLQMCEDCRVKVLFAKNTDLSLSLQLENSNDLATKKSRP